MITFTKKTADTKPKPELLEENRFEQVRRKAAEQHRKSDAEGARRTPQTEGDRTS